MPDTVWQIHCAAIFQTVSEKSLPLAIRQAPSDVSAAKAIAQTSPAQSFDLATLAARFPLPWSAYVQLRSVKNEAARAFYETETLRCGWSVRQLNRQIGSQFYERIALSKNKAAMLKKAEQAEAGDLIALHRRLRCLVNIDLKAGRFSYADAGPDALLPQNAREHWMKPGENPPVGLILCADKGAAEAHYALDNQPNKVLAAEYQTLLPDEKLIAKELERSRRELEAHRAP